LILKEDLFLDVIRKAVDQARADNKLITIGIKPTRPETGYGYIQYHTDKTFAKKVKTFTEKPELSLAKKFLESGDFVWNAGIFIWSVSSIIQAIQRHMPEMAEVFEEIKTKLVTDEEKSAIAAAYPQCKSISIDYGVMEKASNVFVCLGEFSWSDLGSWASIHEISPKDHDNNVIRANALTYDTRNSIIKGSDNKLIVVQGLNGYLVGEFGNVIIVCEKDKEEQFRRFVNDAKAKPNSHEFI
jgi:mannose-1-phosphate guanylyltransferase